MAGRLSQVLANLAAAEKQISSLSGLPPAAVPIQSSSAASIGTTIAQTQALQQAVSAFVQSSTPQLNQIEAMVSAKKPVPAIEAAVAEVQHESNALQTKGDRISSQIGALSSEVLGYLGRLVPIETSLSDQMTTLRGQLENAQNEEEATKRKYYWLLALGPFGLIGLAVALGLYFKWKSQVNDYETQINSLNAEIHHLSSMKSTCQFMGDAMRDLASKISGLRNAIDFLTSNTLTISSDLNPAHALTVIGLMVHAAMTEVNALGMDAA